MVSLGKVCARMLRSFGETEKEEIPGVFFTDSESALKLSRILTFLSVVDTSRFVLNGKKKG